MCGLIGSTGRSEARCLIALGCLSERRGSDSAGVAWQVGEHLRLAKIAQNPLVAFPMTLAPAIRHCTKYGGPLIGHTRQATTGAVTTPNAHPFRDKDANIAWAHNGVITNYRQFGEFEVDSQSLIVGIKTKDFKEYYGPVALLWIQDGKLHAFRKGNPLFRGVRRKAVYLASGKDMLEQIGCKRIKEVCEGRLYIWEGNKLLSSEVIPSNKSYGSYTGAYNASDYDDWDNWRQGGHWDETKKEWVYPLKNSESYGCRGGGRRSAGFRFRPTTKKEVPEMPLGADGLPVEPAEPKKVLDLIPIRPDGLETHFKEQLRQEQLLGSEEELEDESKEVPCLECMEHPKMLARDYCAQCFMAYINRGGGCE